VRAPVRRRRTGSRRCSLPGLGRPGRGRGACRVAPAYITYPDPVPQRVPCPSGVPVLPECDAAGLVGGDQRRALRAPRGAEHAGRARVLERSHDRARALGLLRVRPAGARAPSACCGVRAWLCAVGPCQAVKAMDLIFNVATVSGKSGSSNTQQHAYHSGLARMLMTRSVNSPSSPEQSEWGMAHMQDSSCGRCRASQMKTVPSEEPAATWRSSGPRHAVHQTVPTLKPGARSERCTCAPRPAACCQGLVG